MSSQSAIAAAALVPLIRYRDVGRAIDWLCDAFGFEKHVVVTGIDGNIIYAQLQCGNGLIMVCPAEGSGLDAVMRQPDEIGGAATQCCYLVIADADTHYRRATDAGAEIVHDGQSDTDGRRGYSCRDLEGHLWSFGTFDPWRNQGTPAALESAGAEPRWGGKRVMLRAAAIAALILGTAAAAMFMYPPAHDVMARWNNGVLQAWLDSDGKTVLSAQTETETGTGTVSVRELQAKLDAALRTTDALKAEIEKARGAKEKAAQAAAEARDQLAKAQAATQGWMLRAEQAEAKSVVAAESADAGQPSKTSSIETGSPQPAAADTRPANAAAPSAASTPAKACPPRYIRPRAARRPLAPRYIFVEKDWSSFAAW